MVSLTAFTRVKLFLDLELRPLLFGMWLIKRGFGQRFSTLMYIKRRDIFYKQLSLSSLSLSFKVFCVI